MRQQRLHPHLETFGGGEQQWLRPAKRRCRLERIAAALLVVSGVSTVVGLVLTTSADPSSVVVEERHHHQLSSTMNWVRRSVGLPVANGTNASACVDKDERCPEWARGAQCTENAAFMLDSCRRSCSRCEGVVTYDRNCKDQSSFCGQWAAVGECDSNPNYMRHSCPVTCHLCQSYDCHDLDPPKCADQAKLGHCRSEPERMYTECRWACKWCAMETTARCRRAAALRPAVRRGELDAMFRRAASKEHTHFTPVVHSRSPWIVSFDTFLSAEEADRVIQVGGRGWRRSQAGDGVQAVRTSSTAWCDHNSCGADPMLARLRKRIANLTLVPERNAEHLQVLKYEVGQFYRTHHDQNSPTTSAWGPRMYTFFMYLNDGAEGGETHFPKLNISIKPKRGRAVLWPSVLDKDPNERDFRTEHEAVTVTSGIKYAANYWLHMWDFQEANDRGCGNSEVFGNWPDVERAVRT